MAKKTKPFSPAHTYIAYIRGELQVMSLAAYASETDITAYASETDKRAIYIFFKETKGFIKFNFRSLPKYSSFPAT